MRGTPENDFLRQEKSQNCVLYVQLKGASENVLRHLHMIPWPVAFLLLASAILGRVCIYALEIRVLSVAPDKCLEIRNVRCLEIRNVRRKPSTLHVHTHVRAVQKVGYFKPTLKLYFFPPASYTALLHALRLCGLKNSLKVVLIQRLAKAVSSWSYGLTALAQTQTNVYSYATYEMQFDHFFLLRKSYKISF